MAENEYKNISLPIFFLDETGILNRPDDSYFALGVVKTTRPHELQRAIMSLRDKHHLYEEIKWNKMSPVKSGLIQSMIDIFINNKNASFSCVILKKETLDFKKYFDNNLFSVYKSFSVFLLKRNLEGGGDELGTVIADNYFYPEGENIELVTRAIVNDHYKKVKIAGFVQANSKAFDLLQLTDVLLGAILYDLKLQDNLIKEYPNLKFKTLQHLHQKLQVKNSFFKDKKGARQEKFLNEKIKISIYHPAVEKNK